MTTPANQPVAHPPEASPDAIRQRLAVVRDAFAVERGSVPEPMHAREVAALMALADDPDAGMADFAKFAVKWGVSLDWLLLGDVGALLLAAQRRA